ncbi:PDZ domain-containing protein, partial [Candidatus Parcubacteria bacterium]|nr:PDZ domain-containing protein [Candidatus Parcubacteria bacterium]
MDFFKRHSGAAASLLVVVILIFSLGFRVGESRARREASLSMVTNQTVGQPSAVDFSPFWKAWSILNEKFVPSSTSTKPVNEQARIWGAIEGMTSSLGDPYTVFFPPAESKEFATEIKGSFEGVGMEVLAKDGALVVIAPLKGSPAARAGLLPGDKIIKIDKTDTVGLTTEDAVNLIRGPEGTSVTLTVLRESKKLPFEVKVTRQVIDIPTIESKDLGNDIFYIALYSFSENSPNLFRGGLRKFVESGDSKLILDLRGNPGGYLEAALDMASWFLPPGAVVVREDFGADREETVYRSKGYDIFNDNLKFVILVDAGSASASEILAGALSEHSKATLIGQKTFGKGSVQELVPITSETSLKVTVARWLTPNGNSISKQGIT